jgi:hypothetical protein
MVERDEARTAFSRGWHPDRAERPDSHRARRLLIFSEMTSRPNAKLAFVPPALPTLVAETPGGDEWLHEIKHDGYRGRPSPHLYVPRPLPRHARYQPFPVGFEELTDRWFAAGGGDCAFVRATDGQGLKPVRLGGAGGQIEGYVCAGNK